MDETVDALEQKVAKMEAREVERDEKLTAILAFLTNQSSSRNPDPVPT